MPSISISVSFTAAAAALLRAELGSDWARPRLLFTIEPLLPSGKLPCVGDLVADLRLSPRLWRVEQRSVLIAANADTVIALLVSAATAARLTCDADAERIEFTPEAQAALYAEYVGREQPSGCRVLLTALSAMPDLRAGDVVQDVSVSRHTFLVEDRLFFWTASNEVHVRYLLNLGVKPRERKDLEG